MNGNLNKYTGPWTRKQAAHLLRRTTFGPKPETTDQVTNMGLDATIDLLFSNSKNVPDPPVKWIPDELNPDAPRNPYFIDPEVKYGETWVNSTIIRDNEPLAQQIANYQTGSVAYWVYLNMYAEEINIRSKMAIFWHNHFVVSDFRIAAQLYQYMNSIYGEATGNFQRLTEKMTIDPGMLIYLDGYTNSKNAPNENFARELLELFTLGKGDIEGPGVYSHYTENDIVEIAKVLTGWTILRNYDGTKHVDPLIHFVPARHDKSTKVLSDKFGNTSIDDGGEEEYKTLIDIIFAQDEVAKFICRKFYRYFLFYEIDDEIEANIIEPMAEILRNDNYEVEGALKALLSSEHFFGEEAVGCMIKNPADHILAITKGLNIGLVPEPYERYFQGAILNQLCSTADMSIFRHPDVAGWKAYYQSPSYYRIWINGITLPDREKFVTALLTGRPVILSTGPLDFGGNAPIRVLDVVKDIPNVQFVDDLINYLVDHLYPYGVNQDQIVYLKDALLGGQEEFTWTNEYLSYLDDPSEHEESVSGKLENFFVALFRLPEIHLM